MSKFISNLGPLMEAFIDYREALGHSRITYEAHFIAIDRFYADKYPEEESLTQETVLEWLNDQWSSVCQKATAVRLLGKYITALGKDSYVLPEKIINNRYSQRSFMPYIFTDAELHSLFCAVDLLPEIKAEPFLHEVLPVQFRLIYTCGLRPNEGCALKCENINLKTGEVLILNTKSKKDRMVVMSTDMLKLCRNYDERRKVFARGSEYFFPSWGGKALSSYQLGYHFRDCWKRANPVRGNLTNVRVYDLRHRFASAALVRWLDNGVELGTKLPYLRTYMGHSSLSETLYYVHLLPENLTKSQGIDWTAFDEIIPEVPVCQQ